MKPIEKYTAITLILSNTQKSYYLGKPRISVKPIRTGPSSLEIKDLAVYGKSEFGLPQFQRALSWNWNHQKELLKSLIRGVPIGTIMIWEYDEEKLDMPQRPFDKFDQNFENAKYLVLDGQQRVNFLTLLHLSSSESKYLRQLNTKGYSIYLHINEDGGPRKDQLFTTRKFDEEYNQEMNMICVQSLINGGSALKKKLENGIFKSNPNNKLIGKLYDALTTSEVNVFNLGQDVDYELALLIYERVNLAGKRLRGIDVTEAVYISKYQNLFKKLTTDQKELSGPNKEFEKIFSRKRILNNITVDLYDTITARPKQLDVLKSVDRDGKELTTTKVKNSYTNVIASLKWIKRQMKSYLFIQNDKTITTDYPIIVAATHYRYCLEKKERPDVGKMMKWLALAILRNRYAGKSTNSKMDEDLKISKSLNPWTKLTKNLGHNNNKILKPDFGTFNGKIQNPKSTWIGSLYTATLLWNNAVDPINLTPYRSIEANRAKEMEWHHLFPVSRFKTDKDLSKFLKSKDDSAINFMGNMVHLSKESNRLIGNEMPASYIVPMQNTRHNELELNFLTNTTLNKNAFLPDKINEILDSRASLIQSGINSFLNTLETGGAIPEQKGKSDPFDLIRTNRRGENQTVEYKETLRVHTKGEQKGEKWDDGILVCMKEICGFLNSGGGYLFIGIEDKKPYNLSGMQRDYDVSSQNKDFEGLQGIISQKIGNNLFFPESRSKIKVTDFIEIKNCIIEGVEIIGIFINPWPERNCLYKTKKNAKEADLIFRHGAHKTAETESKWIKNKHTKKWESVYK